MSISPIMKGNAPLMTFSFVTDNGGVVPLPSQPSKFTVHVHDSASVRLGAGSIQNINTSAGTCQYQVAAADTANVGLAAWWITIDLGEPVPRDFDPQHILIEDPTQV